MGAARDKGGRALSSLPRKGEKRGQSPFCSSALPSGRSYPPCLSENRGRSAHRSCLSEGGDRRLHRPCLRAAATSALPERRKASVVTSAFPERRKRPGAASASFERKTLPAGTSECASAARRRWRHRLCPRRRAGVTIRPGGLGHVADCPRRKRALTPFPLKKGSDPFFGRSGMRGCWRVPIGRAR